MSRIRAISWNRITTWRVAAGLAIITTAAAGFALGSGTASGGDEAESAREAAYEQAYDTAFTNGELGYACAISFALLGVIVAATAALNKLTARHA